MKKITSLLLTFIILFSFVACESVDGGTNNINRENSTELVLNENMCALSGFSPKELDEYLKTSFSSYICGSSFTDKELTLYYDNEKKNDFSNDIISTMDGIINEFSSNNEKYQLSYNEGLDSFDVSVTVGVDSTLFKNTILKIEFFSMFYQLLSGASYDTLEFNINVYNSDTNKLVKSVSTGNNLDITGKDWEGSYEDNCFFITFNEDFMPAFGMDTDTFINYLSFYSDYCTTIDSYLGTNAVVLVINDKARFLEAVRKNLSYKNDNIKVLDENYSLALSSDLRTMDIFYDDKVADQEIARLVTTAILETKLIYTIENESFTGWTLDYNIYNSNSKELAKAVHLPEESISLMGQANW